MLLGQARFELPINGLMWSVWGQSSKKHTQIFNGFLD